MPADGVKDGEVAEPKYDDLLRELLETQDARDEALREAAGVREQLKLAEQREKEARDTAESWRQESNDWSDSSERNRQAREQQRSRAESAEKRLAEAEAELEQLKANPCQCELGEYGWNSSRCPMHR